MEEYSNARDTTAAFVDIPLDEISFDEELIRKFSTEKDFKNVRDFLTQMRQIRDDKITHAGYLCFAEKNRLFPNAVIKIARFDGNTVTTFLDRKNIDSNMVRAVDEVLEFIKAHTSEGIIRHRSGKTEKRLDYPMDALREALVNAILHRDYTDTGNIQVRIFEDWLEIWSPGSLPKELDLSRILYEDRAILKNSNLAMIFQNLGLVDNWGTGFKRMNDACVENGNPEPLYSQKAGAFVVTIHKSILTASIEHIPH
ncbi:MAG: ATP-binding protein [Candidatus Marinimicrobia bacterium]|jgi:ATP-dependent DNA helicase RecG|nr:ATP-binding protein [Candidatus Neomarinimicrobiota bacterium]